MVSIVRQTCQPLLLTVLWSALLFANAQTPPPSQDAQPLTYKVIHDHAIGQGDDLIATQLGTIDSGKRLTVIRCPNLTDRHRRLG